MPIVNIITKSDVAFVRAFAYADQSNAPIDLTGYAMWMKLRLSAVDSNVWLRLGTDTGEIVVTDATNGKFKLVIPQRKLADLPPNTYVHSLVRSNGAALGPLPVWTGTLIHSKGPSR